MQNFIQCIASGEILSTSVCLAVVSYSVAAVAQPAGLPDDWQSLGADEFAAAAAAVIDSDASEAEKQEVVLHAWNNFLSDETFVGSGEVRTVLKIIGLLATERPGDLDTAALDRALSSFNSRLEGDSTSLSGVDLYELGDALKGIQTSAADSHIENIARPKLENPRMFSRWMAANPWQSMESHHLYNLFSFVNTDSLDRWSFAARWSGVLTAPVSGRYVFEQSRVYRGRDSQLKVWLGQDLLLNTMGTGVPSASYTSPPVQLSAGEGVDIRIELVHETDEVRYAASAPMALITWKLDDQVPSLIPTSVFSPAEGDQVVGDRSTPASGLKGKYFADLSFRELVVTRIDPTLDMVWTWPPTAPTEIEASRQVLAELVKRLTDDAYLARIAAESDDVVAIEFDRNMWRIAYRMSVADRMALIAALRRNPDVMRRLSPEAAGRLIRGVYMLPDDSHLDFIGEWSLARPQPRSDVGAYPGWGTDTYQKKNTDFYFAIGHMLQGPYWEDAQKLLEKYLVLPNGECNLPIAYSLAYAARAQGIEYGNEYREQYRKLLHSYLDDGSISGDVRVTWLIAATFADEVLFTRLPPRLLRDKQYLIEAMLVAETEDYRFWAMRELAVRYASMGDTDKLSELLGDYGSDFSEPAQEQMKSSWIQQAGELRQLYAKRQTDRKQARQEAYLAELRRRSDRALRREDMRSAARLQTLIDAASAEEK